MISPLSKVKSSAFLFEASFLGKTEIEIKLAQQKQKVADIMQKYSIIKQKMNRRLKKS